MILHYSDSAILAGIREKNEKCIKYICREFFPIVKTYVEHNSGTLADVEDVIQDTLIVLFMQCSNPEFKLTCKFQTYFFAIGRNIWLQRLERKRQMLYISDYSVMEQAGEYETGQTEFREVDFEKMRLFREHFNTLPSECKMILTFFTQKKKMSEIAGMMGYKDEDTAKSRKYACKNMLVQRIKNDPRFKHLIDYE